MPPLEWLQTNRHDKYRNPRCACTPRVKNVSPNISTLNTCIISEYNLHLSITSLVFLYHFCNAIETLLKWKANPPWQDLQWNTLQEVLMANIHVHVHVYTLCQSSKGQWDWLHVQYMYFTPYIDIFPLHSILHCHILVCLFWKMNKERKDSTSDSDSNLWPKVLRPGTCTCSYWLSYKKHHMKW